jgi:hypothetical protein
LRLRTSPNLVGCSTRKSPEFAPLSNITSVGRA